MPQMRLFGLILFVTSIFLAMAAATTQTTHIRFKRPSRDRSLADNSQAQRPQQPSDQVLPPTVEPTVATPTTGIQFASVPVAYPLLIAAVIGLILWFAPAPRSTTPKTRRRKRRHSK